MHALIIGATGATGKPLLEKVLNNPAFTKVTVFVRKAITIHHSKLTIEVIDFNDVNSFKNKVTGDVLFSCLGTTLKQAGSKQAQYQIDYTYQYQFANIAKQNGVSHLVLVSSSGANANAKIFYSRIKGELENAVMALNFDKLTILRPPLLKRPNSDRTAEKLGEKIIETFNQFGLLSSQKPLPTDKLADVMTKSVLNQKTGVIEKGEIWQMANA